MIGDFRRFVRPPVPPPATPTPTPPGPTGPIAPPVAASLDSVRVQNSTGLALTVTVVLQVPQVQKPSITQTIPARGSAPVLFDFGTATDAFMSISIKRADGGQVPPPLVVSLPQPMNGYNGEPFTISVFGSYFNVAPG